jgi:NAD(P)-dependent dehydrogenase (short-subunit alcohol dehydrogenase family)
VLGDAANLDDLDRLYETVRKEKGKIDILFASAGRGELAAIGEVTEDHFDKIAGLNVRGTLFTVQKALPLFNDGGSIILNGSSASIKGFPGFGVYSASKAACPLVCADLDHGPEASQYPCECAQSRTY